MNVAVDPEGRACDPGGVCPSGFVCQSGTCHSVGGTGGGAGGGGGGSVTCEGVVCNQAPGPQCTDPNTKRSFATEGSCNPLTGACEYPFTDLACSMGCMAGLCTGDPCNTVSCTSPPPPMCKSPATLTTFGAAGSCSNGQCTYPPTDTACANGCSAGVCQGQNLCMNVTCNQPPAPTCAGTSARTFMSPGTCNMGTGVCTYNPLDTPCANGCANGVCITPALAFTQTMPRVRFAVNAIDQAPNSMGGHVVVVGNGGAVMKWDGTSFTKITSSTSTTADLHAVWFAGANSAILVGSGRTVGRYNGAAFGVVTGVPATGTGNMIAVHGKDEQNFVIADDQGGWWRFSGTATPQWASGTFGGSGIDYKTTGVWVDTMNRARIVGARTSSGTTSGVVRYYDSTVSVCTSWCEDIDTNGQADGFGAVGPAITNLAVSADYAFLGRQTTNTPRRHNSSGSFDSTFSPALTFPSGGSGIGAITGTTGSTRAIYFLEPGKNGATGHLYRYAGANGLDPGTLGDFYFGRASMGATESGGVVVAEADPINNVNNIYRRNATGGEMLDLGESWTAVSSTGGVNPTVVLVSGAGDVALRLPSQMTWQFRRNPYGVVIADATALNGTGMLLVGSAGKIQRFVTGVINPVVTPVTGGGANDFHGVCRVSDLEAYAVGAAGTIASVNTTLASATLSNPSSKNLNAVDCPATGQAIACGQSGTVLKLSGTTWSPVTPALPSTTDLTSCRLVGNTLFVAGDGVFYTLDTSSAGNTWKQLAAQPKLSHLAVISPNEVYGLSGTTRVVRFDGSAWTTSFSLNSGGLVGGGQVGGKVVYAGSFGTVVEGQ